MTLRKNFSTPFFSEYLILDGDRILAALVRVRETETGPWGLWEIFREGEKVGEGRTLREAASRASVEEK